MELRARYIGRINDVKALGYAGVAEVIACKDMEARIMLVNNVPGYLKAGDFVMLDFSTGKILSVKGIYESKKSFWERFKLYFNQAEE